MFQGKRQDGAKKGSRCLDGENHALRGLPLFASTKTIFGLEGNPEGWKRFKEVIQNTDWLALAEFATNRLVSSTTGISPF